MKNPDNALGEFAIRELTMCALPEEMDTIFAASGPWLKSLSVYHPHRKAVSRHESDGSRTKVYRLQR